MRLHRDNARCGDSGNSEPRILSTQENMSIVITELIREATLSRYVVIALDFFRDLAEYDSIYCISCILCSDILLVITSH